MILLFVVRKSLVSIQLKNLLMIFIVLLNASCSCSRKKNLQNLESNSTIFLTKDGTALLSPQGFSDNAYIKVTQVNIGDIIGIYSDSECKVSVDDIEIQSDDIIENIPVVLEVGSNEFFVKKESYSKYTCDGPLSYTRSEIILNLTPVEVGIESSWSLSHPVPGVKYEIKIGSDESVEVSSNHYRFDNITGSNDITLTASDTDNIVVDETKAAIAGTFRTPTIKLTKNGTDLFTSGVGYSESGIAVITDYAIGDSLEIYDNTLCTGNLVSKINQAGNMEKVPLSFNESVNNFSVKRIYNKSTSITSCSLISVNSRYERILFDSAIQMAKGGPTILTASWDPVARLIGAYKVELNPGKIVKTTTNTTESFNINSTGIFEVEVTVTDNDNVSLSVDDNQEVVDTIDRVLVTVSRNNNSTFLSNPGYSSLGNVSVSGHFEGDKLELYKTSDCSGIPISSIDKATSPVAQFLDVPFSDGINDFYVKRIYAYDTTLFNCSLPRSEASYTKVAFNSSVTISGVAPTLTASWNPPSILIGSYSVNLMPGDSTKTTINTTESFPVPDNSSYTVTVTITDLDGESLTVTGSKYLTVPLGKIFAASFYSTIERSGNGLVNTYFQNNKGKTGRPFGWGDAFFALDLDGKLTGWGDPIALNGAPLGETGFINVFGNGTTFVGLKSDTTIRVWGADTGNMVTNAPLPTETGFIGVVVNACAAAAIKTAGPYSVYVWGDPACGADLDAKTAFGKKQSFNDKVSTVWTNPIGNLDMNIIAGCSHSKCTSFGAIKRSRYSVIWGTVDGVNSSSAEDTPWQANGNTYHGMITGGQDNFGTFAVIKTGMETLYTYTTGSLRRIPDMWPNSTDEQVGGIPPGIQDSLIIVGNEIGYSNIEYYEDVNMWGDFNYDEDLPSSWYIGRPTYSQKFKSITSNRSAFAGIMTNGQIVSWGYAGYNGHASQSTVHSRGGGFDTTKMISGTYDSFAAIRNDGTIDTWGAGQYGTTGGPSDGGYVEIISNKCAFVARKADGSYTVWGDESGLCLSNI